VEGALLLYEKLCANLEGLGYVPNPKDRCVFNKTVNGEQITLLVYVDDILILASQAGIDHFKDEFKKLWPEITEKNGPVIGHLGMEIDSSESGKCKLSMGRHTDKNPRVLDSNARSCEERRRIERQAIQISHNALRSRDFRGRELPAAGKKDERALSLNSDGDFLRRETSATRNSGRDLLSHDSSTIA
jgi:hypothetical protein